MTCFSQILPFLLKSQPHRLSFTSNNIKLNTFQSLFLVVLNFFISDYDSLERKHYFSSCKKWKLNKNLHFVDYNIVGTLWEKHHTLVALCLKTQWTWTIRHSLNYNMEPNFHHSSHDCQQIRISCWTTKTVFIASTNFCLFHN